MLLPKNLANNLIKTFLPLERPKRVRERVEASLFEKQAAAFHDKSLFQVIVCSRRAGKTTGANKEIIVTAEEATEPGNILFLSLTVEQAKTNGYDPLIRDLKELGYVENMHYKKNDTKLTITFLHNDVVVKYSGAEKPNVIEKFRGTKYYLVIIDEAGSFKFVILMLLVDEILTPALSDLNGTLQLRGTPPPVPNTYFEEAYKSEAWSRHYWTFEDNPYVKENVQTVLDSVMKKKGWDKNNPKLLREYKGQFVYDLSRMLLKFVESKNVVTRLPFNINEKTGYFLGVDFGYRDSMAYVVIKEYKGKLYLVECFKQTEMTPTNFSNKLKEVMMKYSITYGKTAADPGGLGRAILEDYRQHHSLNLQDATKRGKGNAFEVFNELLITGRFQVFHTCYEAIKEYSELEKDPKKPDMPLEGQEDHIVDSTLYGIRLTNVYNYMETEPKEESEEIFEQVLQQQQNLLRKSKEIIDHDLGQGEDIDQWF